MKHHSNKKTAVLVIIYISAVAIFFGVLYLIIELMTPTYYVGMYDFYPSYFDEYLSEDEDFSLVFIKYRNEAGSAVRYVIYPDRRLNISDGTRKSGQGGIVNNPAVFKHVFISQDLIISDEDYKQIMDFAALVNLEISYAEQIFLQGGHNYFLAFNGLSRDFRGNELYERYEFYAEENKYMYDILEILEKYGEIVFDKGEQD